MPKFNEYEVRRQAKGQSVGGQFANKEHPENTNIGLGISALDVRDRLEEQGLDPWLYDTEAIAKALGDEVVAWEETPDALYIDPLVEPYLKDEVARLIDSHDLVVSSAGDVAAYATAELPSLSCARGATDEQIRQWSNLKSLSKALDDQKVAYTTTDDDLSGSQLDVDAFALTNSQAKHRTSLLDTVRDHGVLDDSDYEAKKTQVFEAACAEHLEALGWDESDGDYEDHALTLMGAATLQDMESAACLVPFGWGRRVTPEFIQDLQADGTSQQWVQDTQDELSVFDAEDEGLEELTAVRSALFRAQQPGWKPQDKDITYLGAARALIDAEDQGADAFQERLGLLHTLVTGWSGGLCGLLVHDGFEVKGCQFSESGPAARVGDNCVRQRVRPAGT